MNLPVVPMIALGGAFGSVLRHFAGVLIARVNPTDFPLHTLIINVVGSLMIGVVVTVLAERFALNPEWRAFLVVGVLGGFTTFSAFSLETMMLVDRGQMALAALYVVLSVILSILAVFSGVWMGRTLI